MAWCLIKQKDNFTFHIFTGPFKVLLSTVKTYTIIPDVPQDTDLSSPKYLVSNSLSVFLIVFVMQHKHVLISLSDVK
jgi:hypothetical protein